MEVVAKDLGVDVAEIEARANKLHEFNPMLGHRGVRLGISYPEIYEMQARAIFAAAAAVIKEGKPVEPEVMIPLIITKRELELMKELVVRAHEQIKDQTGVEVPYALGTMIELPRAALLAGDLTSSAEFFSFGTNDLTQMTYGYSRDDSGRFLPQYVEQGVLPHDPFQSLDQEGVGQLVRMSCERGREARPDLHLGVCGEHGGDPASIEFFDRVGLDYVSCSPYRVPVARLAAAQAALTVKSGD
jgi:pyruvate,orthophosphate dikinase